jgi:hypothetical protein
MLGRAYAFLEKDLHKTGFYPATKGSLSEIRRMARAAMLTLEQYAKLDRVWRKEACWLRALISLRLREPEELPPILDAQHSGPQKFD